MYRLVVEHGQIREFDTLGGAIGNAVDMIERHPEEGRITIFEVSSGRTRKVGTVRAVSVVS